MFTLRLLNVVRIVATETERAVLKAKGYKEIVEKVIEVEQPSETDESLKRGKE